MKKLFSLLVLTVAALVLGQPEAQAQCDSTTKMCSRHIVPPFVSDGQTYRALVLSNQTAEFQATFFAGSTYRIAAGTGTTDGNLIFSVYDQDHNLLFTNSQHSNAPYWDFRVTTTVNVIIEATLNPASGKESGCAILLIGFKP
ncbi:MAG: hypothetical protein MUC87_21320 [Bacteroidia bacterium]|jgi:hypothetical protein|nr:hypothetical protein [Bacteroidia bacterium]